ncbi:MAG: sel1 repeat family protein [Polyangiaceae bacterium]|nr:sel1 repeat family protein [Polyangiaceae bacterium]
MNVRLPVQVGTSALADLGKAAATFAPGVVMGALGVHAFKPDQRALGVSLFGGGLFLAALALWEGVRAFRTRAADAVLTDTHLTIEGGVHNGLQLSWEEIDAERTRAETITESRFGLERVAANAFFLALSALLANALELAPDTPVPVRKLHLTTKAGRTWVLAEAVHPAEQRSLDALLGTIVARVGKVNDPPAKAPNMLVCVKCGAPLTPNDLPQLTCLACGTCNEVPAETRARISAQRSLYQSNSFFETSVRTLLDQPGAISINRTFVVVVAVCLTVWVVANLPIVWLGFSKTDTFELGWMLAAGWFGTAAAYFAARAALTNRRALRLLATNFGARALSTAGQWACRRCGGPLPPADGLIVNCAYCDADNVLGMDLRSQAASAAEQALSLADMLAARKREQSSRRRIALGAGIAALAASGLLLVSVSVAKEHQDQMTACKGGNAEACLRVGGALDLAIIGAENDPEALVWYLRGCDLNNGEACHRTANLYRWGTDVEPDPAKEKLYRQKACSLGYAEACSFE